MSKTLSVLIVENFIINEGPKWDKFKKGVKKGAVTAATLGSVALASLGGNKISNANRNYDLDMAKNQYEYISRENQLNLNRVEDLKKIYTNQYTDQPTQKFFASQMDRSYKRDTLDNDTDRDRRSTQAFKKRDRAHAEGGKTLVGAAGLGVVPLVAGAHALGAKGEKKKQAKKSLKERLELVKSGMYLNEESADIAALRNKINALRNKISQGLILLPGLKGSAADKMEDSIRIWEDQINELGKKIGEKYE